MANSYLPSRRAETLHERVARFESLAKTKPGLTADSLSIALVTELETFTDSVLEDLIDQSEARDSGFGRELIKSIGTQFYQSWPERKKWLRSFDSWVDDISEREVLTLVDLRNSIAHGGGHLTRKQRSEFTKLVSLELNLKEVIDYTTEGGQLFAGKNSLNRIFQISRRYLRCLDEASCRRYPYLITAGY